MFVVFIFLVGVIYFQVLFTRLGSIVYPRPSRPSWALRKSNRIIDRRVSSIKHKYRATQQTHNQPESIQTLTWFPTGEGLTQQLYFLKSAAYLAMVTNRTLVIPPLFSYHYKDLSGQHISDWVQVVPSHTHNQIRTRPTSWKNYSQPRTNCDQTIYGGFQDSRGNYRGFFKGSKQNRRSMFQPKWANGTWTSKDLIADAIESNAKILCIVSQWGEVSQDFHDSIVLKLGPELSLITESFRMKHTLEPYVAVHWRTGDICRDAASKGIGTCGDPAEWIDKLVDLYPNRSFYVATDEHSPARLAKLERLGHVQSSNMLCLGRLDAERILCDIDMMQQAEVFVTLDISVGWRGRWRSSTDRFVERYRKKNGRVCSSVHI